MSTKAVSTTPQRARARLRKQNGYMERDVDILASHRKPLEEWDTEELAHGRPRDKNGTFRGAPPKWITPAVVAEAKRRLQLRAFGDLSACVDDAIKAVHKIVTSTAKDADGKPIVSTRDRLEASKFIIEMVLGKAKQRVDVEAGETIKAALAGALLMPDGAPYVEGSGWYTDDEDEADDADL